jgi:hypothetical protein
MIYEVAPTIESSNNDNENEEEKEESVDNVVKSILGSEFEGYIGSILPGVINPSMPKYNGSYVKTELT